MDPILPDDPVVGVQSEKLLGLLGADALNRRSNRCRLDHVVSLEVQ
jgi:hypothetical protein